MSSFTPINRRTVQTAPASSASATGNSNAYPGRTSIPDLVNESRLKREHSPLSEEQFPPIKRRRRSSVSIPSLHQTHATTIRRLIYGRFAAGFSGLTIKTYLPRTRDIIVDGETYTVILEQPEYLNIGVEKSIAEVVTVPNKIYDLADITKKCGQWKPQSVRKMMGAAKLYIHPTNPKACGDRFWSLGSGKWRLATDEEQDMGRVRRKGPGTGVKEEGESSSSSPPSVLEQTPKRKRVASPKPSAQRQPVKPEARSQSMTQRREPSAEALASIATAAIATDVVAAATVMVNGKLYSQEEVEAAEAMLLLSKPVFHNTLASET